MLDAGLSQGRPVRLQSPAFGQPWQPLMEMRAVCEHGCSYAPHDRCRCGIHGMRTVTRVLETIEQLAGGWSFFVVGRVALWGRVIPGEKGWRSQYAYPVNLTFLDKPWLSEAARSGVWMCLSAYGVPVQMRRWKWLKQESAPEGTPSDRLVS